MKQITIAGKLGRDAETKSVGQDTVTSFSVAVDSREKRGGAYEKTTLWFDCSLWGKRGQSLAQYLTKGSAVCVVGDFSTRTYQTKTGETKAALEVRVAEITLMGSKGDRPAREDVRDDRASSPRSQGEFPQDDFDDDLPFR